MTEWTSPQLTATGVESLTTDEAGLLDADSTEALLRLVGLAPVDEPRDGEGDDTPQDEVTPQDAPEVEP